MKNINNLNKVLMSYNNKTFEWGKSDCALFVAECVDAQTGSNLLNEFKNKYNSALGALKLLKQKGYNNLEEIYDDYFKSIPLEHALNGDIILFLEDNRMTSGIFYMGNIMAISYEGLITCSIKVAEKAWEVR